MSSFRDFLLNRDHSAAWALAFAMTGIRMGERALLVGDDARLFAQLATKVGLTGHVGVVVGTERVAAQVEAAVASAGVLLEDLTQAALPEVPAAPATYDVAVINAGPSFLSLRSDERTALVKNVHRALRKAGRLLVVEGQPPRFLGLVRSPAAGLAPFRAEGGAARVLELAGFQPVRLLADRDGQRFTEGIKNA
jgi:hypothetical protein